MANKQTTVPVIEGVNFLNLDFYTGGGGFQEGNYIWEKVEVCMHSGFDTTKAGPQRLGVMIHMKDADDPNREVRPTFASMGSKAHESFVPNPATGKGLVPVPGGKATTLNDQTNWAILFKSLVDCDPNILSIASNDLSIFEGMKCHMKGVPEPEGRKGFATTAVTGEASAPISNTPRLTPIVTHIYDDGKPWEQVKPVKHVNGKATTAKPQPVTVTQPAAEQNEDVRTACINGLSEILTTKFPNGGTKLLIRNAVGNYVKTTSGDDMFQAVLSSYFSGGQTDESLTSVLSELGFKLENNQIVQM